MQIDRKIMTDPNLSLCKGQPIIKPLGDVDVGINVHSSPLPPAIYKFSGITLTAKIEANVFFGVCGPSWATTMHMIGETQNSNQEFVFSIEDDEMSAGLIAGAALGLTFELRCEYSYLDPSCFFCSKKARVGGAFKAGIDLIQFYATAIKFILNDGELPKSKESVPHGGGNVDVPFGSYGMLDTVSRSYMDNHGFMLVKPYYSFEVNAIKLLTEMIPALLGIYKALDNIHIELESGPFVGLAIPVRLEIEKIIMGEAVYQNVTYDAGSQKMKSVLADNTKTPDKQSLSVVFKESPSADIVFGLFFELSFFSLWHIEAKLSLYLLALLGVDFKIGTYDYKIDAAKEEFAQQECTDTIEVVFV